MSLLRLMLGDTTFGAPASIVAHLYTSPTAPGRAQAGTTMANISRRLIAERHGRPVAFHVRDGELILLSSLEAGQSCQAISGSWALAAAWLGDGSVCP